MTDVVEAMPVDETFELLAHETRLQVLRVLNAADGPVGFSELRECVGVRDSGQFNYHLKKLTDRFVSAGEEGYSLAPPGRRVVGAVLSGGYTKALEADAAATDASCPNCGTAMELRFRADGVTITCPDCELDYTTTDIPPGVLEGWPREAVPAVVDRWLGRNHATAGYGFCYNCDGRIDSRVRLESDADAPDWLGAEGGEGLETILHYECRRCGRSWHSAVPAAVLSHPAVAGFHYEHGIDVRETPTWDLDWLEVGLATVVGEDPVRVELPVTLDGDTLLVTLDRDAEVVETSRS